MAAPGVEFCFTGGPWWSRLSDQALEARWTPHMCWGGPCSCSSCPGHPTHVTLQGGLSLSLSAAVITASTLIMTFSDITDNILLISLSARQAQFRVTDV